jgi:hypothetical protein
MPSVSAIFMSYHIGQRRPGKSNTTTILAATTSYPVLRPIILCQHFGKVARLLDARMVLCEG